MSTRRNYRRRRYARGLAALLAAVWSAAAVWAAPGPVISAFQNRAGAPVAVAGDVIDLIGSSLANDSAAATGWPLPTSLASTQVLCNNYPAPLLSVAPDRIRIQLPWELAGLASAQIRIAHGTFGYNLLTLPLSEFGPAILGADSTSITAGQAVTFRVIGLGPRNSNPITGNGPAPDAAGSAFVHFIVWIGGVPAPIVSNALATGPPPEDAGVQAVTVQIPSNIASGDGVPVQIQIGGMQSAAYNVSVQSAPIQVSLAPGSVQVPLNGSFKFDFSVQGSDDTTLKWSIDPNSYDMPNSGAFYGTINNGVFSAAYTMSVPNWAIVRATHSSGAFATALVQLVALDHNVYRILPDSPVIAAGESISLTLVGPDGAPVSGVSWSISDGFGASYQNTYTAPLTYAPALVKVNARLPGNFGYLYDVATTAITIDPPRAQITGTSPSVAHIGEAVTFQGTGVSARVVYAWFTAADGSRLRSGGPNQPIIVPHGAVSGPAWLDLNGGSGAEFLSAPFPITILPRLRLHASRQRVSSGESIQVVAATPDIPGPWALTWRADFGSVDSKGVFLAPAVTQPAYARIWACLLPATECGTTIVEVVPFRLETDPLIVNPGETVQLQAWRGTGEVRVTWQAVTANITVTPDGALTAGPGTFDGGLAVVSAAYGNITQSLNLSIRTAGAVAHTAEFYDWLGPDNNNPYYRLALGAFAGAGAVNGNWLYALSSSIQYYAGPWRSTWLDVYQLDDRKNPVWAGAVEAPSLGGVNPTNLYLEGNHLYVTGVEAQVSGAPTLLLVFDISGGYPVLLRRQYFDGNPAAYRQQGIDFSLDWNPNVSGPATLKMQDYGSGISRSLTLDYTPVAQNFQSAIGGTTTWAAVMFVYLGGAGGADSETVVFDITGSQAEPIAILPSGGFDYSVTAMQDLLVVGGDVYQVSANGVNLMSQLPAHTVLDFDPATKRILTEPIFTLQEDGYRVVDLSDPANPKTSATTVHSYQWTTGKLGPDYFVLLRGPQNVGVFPIEWRPGVTLLDQFPATPWMNDVRVRDGYLYWAGPGWGIQGRSVSSGIFEVDDISSMPSQVVATMDRPGDEVAWAIELNGPYAYVGTDSELIVYDISAPAAPVQSVVLGAPAISLALLGNYLYAGSNSGKTKLLLVYDVSTPGSPRLVNSILLPDFAYSLAAQPGWLAVAMGKQGLALYSLANPGAPILVNLTNITCWGVAGDHNLLYAAEDLLGLVIYDVSKPANPTQLSTTSLAAGNETFGSYFPGALSVSVEARGIAWLCSPKDGRVYGLDVRNPKRPRPIAEVTGGLGTFANTYALGWNGRLYVAGNDAAYDVSTPQNVGLYDVPQTTPGAVLPDRYNDAPPVAHEVTNAAEPLKARWLQGVAGLDDAAAAMAQHRRAVRTNRPEPGAPQRKPF